MMKKNKWQFMAPDEGGGSQGMAAVAEPAEGVQPEHVETPPEKVETPTTVDAKALATEFGNVLSERFKTPTEPTKKVEELTAEEAKKLLNVWEPDDEFLKEFDNLDTKKSALGKLRDGFIKHADTITQYRLREIQRAMEEKFSPALAYMQQMQEQQATERFAKSYPQLADDAMQPLIRAVADSLKEKGKTYDDEKTLFKDLAEGVEAVIKVSNPTFKLSVGSSPAKPKGQSNNSIPVTTPGAGGGTGGKPTESGNKPRGLSVFEK